MDDISAEFPVFLLLYELFEQLGLVEVCRYDSLLINGDVLS